MEVRQTTYSAVLGAVLAGLRKSQGIEQGDMATRLGVSQASYSRLEGGKSAFSVNQMYQAADALNIPPMELFQRVDNSIQQLQANGVEVVAQLRANATQAQQGSDGVGSFIVGAALGGLLIGLLSNK